MSDDDLIRRGDALNACRASEHRYEAHDAIEALPAVTQPAPDAAADRIAALTEQLSAARRDAEEAEAYAEELEKELNTCRMAQAVMDNTVADLEAKLAECEARLGKAVEDAEKYQYAFAAQSRKLQAVLHIEGVRDTLARITEKPHDRA